VDRGGERMSDMDVAKSMPHRSTLSHKHSCKSTVAKRELRPSMPKSHVGGLARQLARPAWIRAIQCELVAYDTRLAMACTIAGQGWPRQDKAEHGLERGGQHD
jgi:hypothetical protein